MAKKSKSQTIGCCVKCLKVRPLQRHHLLPLRFFGRNKSTLFLCDKCHKEIEAILPQQRKLRQSEYISLHWQWLQHKPGGIEYILAF